MIAFWFALLNGFRLACCELTREDLAAVERLRKTVDAKSVVFVDDSGDVGLMRKVWRFSGSEAYHAVLTSDVLENVLRDNESQFEFFKMRTMIVTEEDLNFTGYLNRVVIPYFLTWVIFREFDRRIYVPVSCTVFFVNSTRDSVTVQEVYNLKPESDITVRTSWEWNELDPKPLDLDIRRNDFREVGMDMLIIHSPDICGGPQRNQTMLQKIECVQAELLGMIGHRLNFRINVVECVEKEFPYSYPNGTESELFRRLRYREVDFSVASHIVTRRNFFRMDYVWPTFLLRSRMYIRQGSLTGRWASYLRPLESSVWWGMLTWIILTGFILCLFEKFLGRSFKLNLIFLRDLFMSTLKALQVFCNQALSDIPECCSIRMVYFFTFFLVLIFFQAYCGYLASSLTVIIARFPFTDLHGFFEDKQYKIMTLTRGFHKYYFKKVVALERQDDFMIEDDELPPTVEDAVRKLCTEDYLAFTEFREDLLNLDKIECRILEIPSAILTLYVSIGSPRNFPYRELVTRELTYLKGTGIVKRLSTRLATRSEFLDKDTRDDFLTVSFSQIYSIFILLGFGVFISVAIFICELMTGKTRKRFARRVIPIRRKLL